MHWSSLLDVLCCPACRGELTDERGRALACQGCGAQHAVEQDVPSLFAGEAPTREFYESAGRRERQPSPHFDLWHSIKAKGLGQKSHAPVAIGAPLAQSAPWVLELGCGWGSARHFGATAKHVGVDLSHAMLAEMRGLQPESAGIAADATRLPFRDRSVPFVLTHAFLEHLPAPELVLEELARVVAPGGTVCHVDAWFVRPWASTGVTLVSWRNATWRERLLKLSVLVREPLPVRAARVIPRRVLAEWRFARSRGPRPLSYTRLQPNYDLNLFSDEDATVSLDPHDVLLYYLSRGFESLGPQTWLERLAFRGPVVVRRPA